MEDIQPLEQDKRAPTYNPKPPARTRFKHADERAVLEESLDVDIDNIKTSSGESMQFKRASVGRRTMRKLSRGIFSVQSEIDLHGMTAPEAKSVLRDFVKNASLRGLTCIRVIHGKGIGSGESGPILKNKVNNWLRRWDEILAFVSTKQVHGGTGAVYVLLKKE
jgi:DNA-nicking Smr family endonuclease